LWNSVEGAANLVLSVILASRYGIVGVAMGTFVPLVFSKLLIQPIYVCRIAGIPYWEYAGNMAKNLATAAACLLIPLLLTHRYATPDYKRLFLIAIPSLLTYVVPLFLFAFNHREKTLLRQALLPRRAADPSVV
jgi:hypothetical protein